MKWSSKNNRWESDVYVCKECDREFMAHSVYMQHVSYDHRKKGIQKTLLLLGFLL
jgi:hypothetical protein